MKLKGLSSVLRCMEFFSLPQRLMAGSTTMASRRGFLGLYPSTRLMAREMHPTSNPPPKQHVTNFSVLGEAVPVSSLQKREKQKWVSGTSFATPIAAAVAANRREFARQQQKEWLPNTDEMAHLHRSEGMMTVFKAMGRAQDGMNFLQPWTLFYPEKSVRRMTERIRSALAESLGTSHAIGGDICETASVAGFSVTGLSDISGSTLEGDGPSSLEEAIALLLLVDPVLKTFFGHGVARSGFINFQNHFSTILRLHASRLRRVARTELEKGFGIPGKSTQVKILSWDYVLQSTSLGDEQR